MASRFGDVLVEAIEKAERWAIFDPEPAMRSRIDTLVDSGDPALIRLFTGRIAFGTAGLRAPVGPGPNRMNALVVRQATVGVVRWLQANGIASPKVVIGFDARPDSASFATHVAAAVASLGGTAVLADDAVATPVVARAVLTAAADAAVVVTASHNPPADNGYKLYLGDGLQLVAPADTEIASAIEQAADTWSQYGPAIDDHMADIETVPANEWIAAHRTSALEALLTDHRDCAVAYTAMHGVGGSAIVHAFEAAGFPSPSVVASQFEPDGSFPTVLFPNPEEPGALDQVIALATEIGANAALANDPDADRLAVAVPDRAGQFRPLSGNQLGVLLGDHVLRHTTGANRLVARSVVSSRLLDSIAASAGVRCEVTLTGFKWIARPIVDFDDHEFVFGYEEAIGYCVGDRVRDKDGISAALVAAEMIAAHHAQGRSVWDRLDELAAQHGVYATQPLSKRFDDDPARVQALMDQIAADPPSMLAGSVAADSGPVGLGSLPPTAGIHLVSEDRTQVIIRPSGTEPKVKAYLEVIEPVSGEGADAIAHARQHAAARLGQVAAEIDELFQR
jgi:phosphomannomutase